ncbi:MAG: hypothetical protein HYZ58_05235 [Acidobacteria bacterium]|nr:hypothetical protein [Acidobacteriota bacterium]
MITTSTENRVPSSAVKTSAEGDGGGVGLGDGVGEGDGDGCGCEVEGVHLGALDKNASRTIAIRRHDRSKNEH